MIISFIPRCIPSCAEWVCRHDFLFNHGIGRYYYSTHSILIGGRNHGNSQKWAELDFWTRHGRRRSCEQAAFWSTSLLYYNNLGKTYMLLYLVG